MRRVLGVLVVALASLVLAPAARSDDGVRVQDFVIETASLVEPANVRVLLPTGYDESVDYPVLYLLHGGVGSYVDWTAAGRAEEITAGHEVIVVMPDAGGGGWYSDWKNHGAAGPPMWETFHIDELIPWVDATFSTIAHRSGRAIAGLSMGGFGAMSYAARHPDVFVTAASFSGAVDPVHATPGGFDAVQDATVLSDGALPGSVWGPRVTSGATWYGHNPTDLAANLRGLDLVVRTGNGQVPYGVDPIEYGCHEMSVSFHDALVAEEIEHVWDDYGAGGHSWDLWARGLEQTMPLFMDTFADPPAVPSKVTFTAVEPSWSVYGWDVTFDRTTDAITWLSDANEHGFTLQGEGVATITTPAFYAPSSTHLVDGTPMTADDAGRLHLTVDLGTALPLQPLPTATVTIV